MKLHKVLSKIVFVASILAASVAHSAKISASDQFIDWESQHNPATYLSDKFDAVPLDIPHIEFRIDHPNLVRVDNYMRWLYGADLGPHQVIVDFADYLPKEVTDSLLFTQEGHQWIRWPLSPFDTEFKTIIEQYLKDRQVPYKMTTRLKGKSTSSRSILEMDPAIGYTFSSKTSTNATAQGVAGQQYRPYPIRWGHLNRRLSDYYYTQRKRLKYLDVAWEAALIGLPPVLNSQGKLVDASMTVRLMDKVAKNKVHQMSGFVLNDLVEIKRISRIAGITSEEFLFRCAKAFGGALAEMHLVLGFNVTSAHLQNIRFELDKNYLPTGRMITLDLSDGAPIRPIVEANGGAKLLAEWDQLTPIDNIYAHYNKTREEIETLGDDRWLEPFRKNPKAYAIVAEAMADRITELTQLSPTQAREMINDQDHMSISWGGTNAEFMAKLKPRTHGQICRDLFRKPH